MRLCMTPYSQPDEIDRLVYHMASVATYATNEWASGFAKSIQRQSRRRGWRPSPKQLNLMRDLVADLFLHGGHEEGDFDVVE